LTIEVQSLSQVYVGFSQIFQKDARIKARHWSLDVGRWGFATGR
jgi:hypothetical protein